MHHKVSAVIRCKQHRETSKNRKQPPSRLPKPELKNPRVCVPPLIPTHNTKRSTGTPRRRPGLQGNIPKSRRHPSSWSNTTGTCERGPGSETSECLAELPCEKLRVGLVAAHKRPALFILLFLIFLDTDSWMSVGALDRLARSGLDEGLGIVEITVDALDSRVHTTFLKTPLVSTYPDGLPAGTELTLRISSPSTRALAIMRSLRVASKSARPKEFVPHFLTQTPTPRSSTLLAKKY